MEHLLEGNTYVFTQEKVDRDSRKGYYNGKKLSERGLYKAFIPFKSDPSKYKIRPVLLLEDSSAMDTQVNVLLFTTAISDRDNYKFNQIPELKYPILNWRTNGFDTPSYVVFSYDEDTMNYYSVIGKDLILEPISARGNRAYDEFLMSTNQYIEILRALKSKRNGDPLSKVNSKVDPKSEYFDWKTMQIPEDSWKEYRKEVSERDKNKEEIKVQQKKDKLKQDFKNLKMFYLYNKGSKSVGEMTYSGKIFKDDKPKRYKKTTDWDIYESYMGKYFPVIEELKDEISSEFLPQLPTENPDNTKKFKEHILSDGELRAFLEV